ncbi:MAG: M20/M25/M40 family metallo-hydrolase, partial [Planctomycetes bacterium]|nr:M20/M25/M40 family metallo-hydrolase [Planctomycetota bacterium]
MYTLLAARNRGLQAEALEFARDLIRTPSPSQHEHAVARLVADRMGTLGFDRVLTDEFGNVVGILFGRQTQPTVMLNAHMDTAEAGESAAWSTSAHAGDVRDDVLYGLGASDCKAGLAAQIYAACLLKRSLLPLRGNLIVAATVSEEQGGSLGLRHLMRDTLPSLGLQPDFVVLGEPTSLSIYYGHDGSAMFEVVIDGPDRFQV